WLVLATRVGHSLPRLLEQGETIGLDAGAHLRAAVAAVAATTPTSWGERHGYAPLGMLAQFGLSGLGAAEPSVAGEPLAGDADCVAATGWLPGTPYAAR